MLSLTLLLGAANAGLLSEKTTMSEWPEREIDADLVTPRGWLRVGLGADMKVSSASRDDSGALTPHDDATWTYSRLWLKLDQGFSQRLSLYCHIPYVYAHLDNAHGADVTTRAFGDIHTGFAYQPWIDTPNKLAIVADLKAPSGVEWPSDFSGGEASTGSFLTGTGITNAGLSLRARRAIGPVAPHLDVGYTFTIPTVVGDVVQTDGWGNGWLDPGDELHASAGLDLQLGDRLLLGAGAVYSRRGVYRVGIAGEGVWKLDLHDIPDSDGWFLDAQGTASFAVSEHLGLRYDLGWQAAGTSTELFDHLGLEEFSPQPGLTHGLTAEVRW